jgi:hypothetical protein
MDIKAWWTFDPACTETTQFEAEATLVGTLAVWITEETGVSGDKEIVRLTRPQRN